MRHGRVRIGISGWTYKPWRGVFYPEKLRQKDELAYAAKTFPSVEINGTFYSLQRPSSYKLWATKTPPGFEFAVKGSRYITHLKRLHQIEAALANFFASGVLALGDRLGPFLWQFPPNFKFDPEEFEAFLELLPRDTDAAVRLGSKHEDWLKDRIFLEPEKKRKLRHAIEIRHASFATPDFIKMLRRHKTALVCSDAVGWPRLMDVTADFVYCRLHGAEELYASGYDDAALDVWAARVAAWARGQELHEDAGRVSQIPAPKRKSRDVYVYFDNDAKVRAPFDARALIEKVDRLLEAG
ncbi:DUF72 domain-containing protein [Acidipila rosea]|uniref:Uncharacterized protein YecE (DUF72 family) n=1 Tax=Acidipila rosea TaxID=768535 RepID=A0A4R1KWR6_9BACT|nr:DUF72 domain-containing protein [Acidipila rosea]TCK69732.1 uncharacterized protein YecE (DUF72 family) [Acidipila rosea]